MTVAEDGQMLRSNHRRWPFWTVRCRVLADGQRSGRAYLRRTHVFLGTQHAEGHVAPLGLGSIANSRSERVIDHGGVPSSKPHSLFQPGTSRSFRRIWTLVSTPSSARARSTKDCPRRVRFKG